MQFWNSESNLFPHRGFLSLFIFSVMIMVVTTSCVVAATTNHETRATPWLWQPWITLGAGHENDLILDPDFNRTVVPGGSFMDGVAGFSLTKPFSRTGRFRLFNRNSLERFTNTEGRTLFAGNLLGDFNFAGHSPWRGRLTLSGDYFNDSGSPSFRRMGGGLESGLGLHYPHWNLEVSGYYQSRRYPNVAATSDTLTTTTYSEDQLGGGGLIAWNPTPQLVIRTRLSGKATSALDPLFDSTSWTTSGSFDWSLGSDTRLSAAYTHQARNFSNRTSDRDQDSYDRIGCGITRRVSPSFRLVGRWAYSTYTYPQGGQQSTTRVTLAGTYFWGRPHSQTLPSNYFPVFQNTTRSLDPGSVLVGIYAPQAKLVSVSGTFNGWQPQPLSRSTDTEGWWETTLTLEPGTYEYVYTVDGEIVTPPEATRTANDGFGGRNGILEIQSTNQ